jgi:hypothetical protein
VRTKTRNVHNRDSQEANLSISALRSRFSVALAALCYDNADLDSAKAEINRLAPPAATPEQWCEAAERARLPCRRCAGTGRYVTMVLNGQPTGPGGECFRCGGRGTQDAADGHRNRVHDRRAIVEACRGLFGGAA